ncbi:hypothetical protein [Saccharothrix longispora]|uniref:SPW repeat domain-containing protein n=1 Tax=Saccharothrix longispora TaxID=33920 RepID=UPI0028FD8BC9|nr:hypothetical protein [Saccharothrix longispora]MDU0293947.1 hypothetical protein [Saccharothrix longispora]
MPEVLLPVVAHRASARCAVLHSLLLVVGLWLIASPFALGAAVPGTGITGGVREVLTGSVVVVVSLVGAMAPLDAPWTGPLLCVLGLCLAGVSARVGDGHPGGRPVMAVNGFAVGCVVAVLAALAAVLLLRGRSAAARPASPPFPAGKSTTSP